MVSVSVAIVYMVKPDIHSPAGKAPPFRGNQEKEKRKAAVIGVKRKTPITTSFRQSSIRSYFASCTVVWDNR